MRRHIRLKTIMRPYRFSDELIGDTEATKSSNKTDRHLLDKGIGLQRSNADW